MLKTAATYVTFLAVVSCIYYVSYWWVFDIDVLSLFEAQDFLLGIIFPLRYSGFYFLSLVFVMGLITIILPERTFKVRENSILDSIKSRIDDIHEQGKEMPVNEVENIKNELSGIAIALENRKKNYKKGELIVILIMSLFTAGCVYMIFHVPYDKFISAVTAYMAASTVYHIASRGDGLPSNLLDLTWKKNHWTKLIDHFIIIAFLYMPISAITTGYSESQAVIQGKRFHYVLKCVDS